MHSSILLPLIFILLCALTQPLPSHAASYASSSSLPLTNNQTVPVLQWKYQLPQSQSIHQKQLQYDSSRQSTSGRTLIVGSDGSGIFSLSSMDTSTYSTRRQRAVDGATTWTRNVTIGLSDLDAPLPSIPCALFLDEGMTRVGSGRHLYSLCAGGVLIKRWWDSGVVQWTRRVDASAIAAAATTTNSSASFNQLIGITGTSDPPSLLISSTTTGSLISINTKTGFLVSSFDFAASPLSNYFTSLTLIEAFLPPSSNITILLAHAVSTTNSTTSLIAFRVGLPSLQIVFDTQGLLYTVLITNMPASINTQQQQVYSYTYSLITDHLYVRTQLLDVASLWILSYAKQFRVIDPRLDQVFPIGQKMLEIGGAAGMAMYILPSKLIPTANMSNSTSVYGVNVETSEMTLLVNLSLLVKNEEEYWLLTAPSTTDVASSTNSSLDSRTLIFFSSSQFSSLLLNASALNSSNSASTPPQSWSWSFSSYEIWSNLSSTGERVGTKTIQSFQSGAAGGENDLTNIVDAQLMQDFTTGNVYVFVRTSIASSPSSSSINLTSETWYSFTTQSSPSCNTTASDCTSCSSITGSVTARQCAYCASSQSCAEYQSTTGFLIQGQVCASAVTYTDALASQQSICPASSGDDDGGDSTSLLLLGLLLALLVLCLLIPLYYLIRRTRFQSQNATATNQLKAKYQALSPSPSFAFGSTGATSPKSASYKVDVQRPLSSQTAAFHEEKSNILANVNL